MVKSSQVLPLLANAFCFLSLFGSSYAEDYIYVQGKVYCDTCRAAFETELTEYINGAKVKLECHDRESGHLTYSIEGLTDSTGSYKIPVQGDHEEEICEVHLVKSPLPDCSEILKGGASARVLITANNGITDTARYANSLGFLRKEALSSCTDALKAIGLPPEAMIPVSKN
ncbi:Pollen Ole e 1 allergen/extensin [Macleaya cordata]|uniref:Pollen Ole e 1 allergen/extensin n=1 Tax=Macleaya cordata TaxID=56857 RepID=A0A200QS67_MACCD|nr:Pollen Ole e 1 allergen/extensin [Macleaya cordata]